jgi:N-acetylneuraminate synthase/N,N'-diacetyllegionaminate synthase
VYAPAVRATVLVGGHWIGSGHPCFVIAEVGVNHNGDLDLAHNLVDVAADAGADAVKFQTFTPERLAAVDAPKAEYQAARDAASSQLDMLRRLRLDREAHVALQRHAADAGIVFLSSAFDLESVELLDALDVPAIKVPSGEITNRDLLAAIGATGRPALMSTGMATLDEVDRAVEWLEAPTSDLLLFHCVSRYPAPPEDANLRAMNSLRERYNVPVGWSDHTEGIAVSTAAVALGADAIEKHITLDRTLPGPDHAASLEPKQFAEMVAAIRTVEVALGSGVKAPAKGEADLAAVARKSLHWSRALEPGAVISNEDLVALRPGTGIPPSESRDLIGRRVAVATVVGRIVRRDDVDRSPAP